jgi:hypothetical protein
MARLGGADSADTSFNRRGDRSSHRADAIHTYSERPRRPGAGPSRRARGYIVETGLLMRVSRDAGRSPYRTGFAEVRQLATMAFGPVEVVHEDAAYSATFGRRMNGRVHRSERQRPSGQADAARNRPPNVAFRFLVRLSPGETDRATMPTIATKHELDAHVFSRLSMTGDTVPRRWRSSPFPHVSVAGIGLSPLDRFGFRAHPDRGCLENRASSHKLVCCSLAQPWSFRMPARNQRRGPRAGSTTGRRRRRAG